MATSIPRAMKFKLSLTTLRLSSVAAVLLRPSRISAGTFSAPVTATRKRGIRWSSTSSASEIATKNCPDARHLKEDANRAPNISSNVPEDFGSIPGGSPISNKDQVFDEIDKALGVSKPPDFEVILTDHLAYTKNPISKFLHLTIMRFGHIAIRYTTSDGKSRIMNILGNFEEPGASMVNFFEPSEYFFGTTDEQISHQWGIYNRPFVGVRVENVSKGATDALHAYFKALDKASEIGGTNDGSEKQVGGDAPGSSNRGAVRFQLVEVNLSRIAREVPAPFDRFFFNVADWIRGADDRRKAAVASSQKAFSSAVMKNKEGEEREFPREVRKSMIDVRQAAYQAGNCAQWTSGGLDFVGLIRKPRLFPKAILVDILEDEYLKNGRTDNVHVVYYDEVKHASKVDPYYKFLQSALVSPLKPIRSKFYNNMEDFASVVVRVPEGSDKAMVVAQKPRKYPQSWLLVVSATTTYVPAAVLFGLVDHIGPIGPTVAAGWLFLNWWLH